MGFHDKILKRKDKLLLDTSGKGFYCIFAENSMIMKRFAIISALAMMFFAFSGKASAQILSDVPDMKGKVTVGGDFDFGMSGYYLNFAVAPQVGYRILSPWEVGIRGVYNLNCFFDAYYGNEYYHYFGVAPYTNCQVYNGLFLHVEDEMLYGLARYQHETVGGEWYNGIFVGGGYRSYSYEGSYYYFMVLYNLSYGDWEDLSSALYPYASPIALRVGLCFSL